MKNRLNSKLALALALTMAITTITPAFAQYNNQYRGYDYGYGQTTPVNTYGGYTMQPLQGNVTTVNAGTVMDASISGMVSSENSAIGMPVRAILGSNVMAMNGAIALPAGTVVEGQVFALTRAGGFGRNGKLGVRFTSATTPSGQRVPISAKIATQDGSGILTGGTMKTTAINVAKTTVTGTAVGAIAGTALAPMAGGKVGKGAAYGTAVGAGAGFLSNVFKKGEEALIPSNFQLQLDSPVSIGGGY